MPMVSRCALPTLGACVALLVGCAMETYPPAVPLPFQIPESPPPINCYIPPATIQQMASNALATAQLPTASEWKQWQVVGSDVPQVCTGKGKKRRCKAQKAVTAVDQANKSAVVEPTIANTQLGQSGRVRYPYDKTGSKIYKIITSPSETTWLLLPASMPIAVEMLLDSHVWEETYTQVGEEGERQHLIAIRPRYTELRTRAVINIKNAAAIQLDIESQERPGMLRVSWVLPEPPPPPAPSPDQVPPVFDNAMAYDQYTLRVDSKYGMPAWMPTQVIDDGKNTMIRFPRGMEGLRSPVASGIQQNGQPTLVATRLYMRRDQGYWLYVQGLHPAVELRDGTSIVRAIRHVPPPPPASPMKESPDAPYQPSPSGYPVRALPVATWPEPRQRQ